MLRDTAAERALRHRRAGDRSRPGAMQHRLPTRASAPPTHAFHRSQHECQGGGGGEQAAEHGMTAHGA
jgi:hypothetical protein